MNLIAAKAVLPINERLNRSPKLTYLPRRTTSRWWRPRVTLRDLFPLRRPASAR
ncbi:MAG: hypothetical protein AAFU55_04225 [Pseudomonadota bacterium]